MKIIVVILLTAIGLLQNMYSAEVDNKDDIDRIGTIIDIDSLANDVLAAIVSAAIAAVIAIVYNKVRNRRLEKAISSTILSNGCGIEYNKENKVSKFTVQVHNYSNSAIRVWSLVFIADKFNVPMSPDSKYPLFNTPMANLAVLDNFKSIGLHNGNVSDVSEQITTKLPPKTMCVWSVDLNGLSKRDWKIKKFYIVFEYPTIFGTSKIVRVEVIGTVFNMLRDSFEELNRKHIGSAE
jgi:hypothetical protein